MTLKLTKTEKILGWVFLASQMLVLPFVVAFGFALTGILLGNPDLILKADTAVNLICFYLNALLAIFFFPKLLGQSLRNCRGRWKQTLLTALKGFGLYWAINLVVTGLILTLDPDFSNVNDAYVGTMLAENPLLMTVAVIFAAPLAEECLFRGWMFTGLAEKSVPLAYLVTCVFFSSVHILGYLGSYEPVTLLLCLLQYVGPSFALCWTCRRDDSLCAPLLIHMVINALGCLLM